VHSQSTKQHVRDETTWLGDGLTDQQVFCSLFFFVSPPITQPKISRFLPWGLEVGDGNEMIGKLMGAMVEGINAASQEERPKLE